MEQDFIFTVQAQAGRYKYKFQGQERQEDLNLGWDSFKYRNYDYAIGRFFNVDPLADEYVHWSPYVFSGNRLIDSRELEGLEPHTIHKTLDDAAINFATQYNGLSIRANVEINTWFYQSTDNNGNIYYSYTTPAMGTEGIATGSPEPIPDGTTLVGEAHTHSADSNNEINGDPTSGDNFPSYHDLASVYRIWLELKDKGGENVLYVGYVVTPNGTIYKFQPSKQTKNFKDDVKEVDGASDVVPSDPNSNTRKNNISPNRTPKILPINLDKDDYYNNDNNDNNNNNENNEKKENN